jgi:hypothetical protein
LTSDVAPYFWDLHVVGTFTNTTGATVDGLSVMLFFDVGGSPTGTGQLDVKVPVGPGATVSWSGDGIAETQVAAPPTTATISNAYWSYSDPALVLC